MIRVQQIADLEARVLRAVDLIERLRAENHTLSAELSESRERLQESEARSRGLEKTLDDLRSEQEKVEQIVVRALDKLDGLEDAWPEQRDEPPEIQDAPADETPAGAVALPPDPPPNPPGSGASATGESSFGTGGR